MAGYFSSYFGDYFDVGDQFNPPSPPIGGGFGTPSIMAQPARPGSGWRDDRDLLEMIPIVVEVINARN